MSTSRERLMELLTDRALVGLGQREQIELAELLVNAQDVDVNAFDAAATSIALASIGNVQKLPSRLAGTIEQGALGIFDAQGPSGTRPASDYAKTREIEKLAPPSFSQTQVDPISAPPSIEPESIEPDSIDYKRTLVIEDGLAPTPTLTRPGDPSPQTQRQPQRQPAPLAQPRPSYTPAQAFRQTPAQPQGAPPSFARPPMQAPPQMRSSMPSSQSAHSSLPSGPISNVVAISRGPRAPSRAFAIGGWIAAAACFALAIGAYVLRSPADSIAIKVPTITTSAPSANAPPIAAPAPSQTPAELREALLAAQGSARAEWSPTKDPLGKAATGEVVWNKDQQKGTMRFRGLAKNDPKSAQYQLWIFDKTRDDKYPVDGGVFDVDSETGDVVVAIRATLPVAAPVLFAVTLERPGGVVVSKRDRIVVTAKLPAG